MKNTRDANKSKAMPENAKRANIDWRTVAPAPVYVSHPPGSGILGSGYFDAPQYGPPINPANAPYILPNPNMTVYMPSEMIDYSGGMPVQRSMYEPSTYEETYGMNPGAQPPSYYYPGGMGAAGMAYDVTNNGQVVGQMVPQEILQKGLPVDERYSPAYARTLANSMRRR
jgi:hypothetical protein